MVTKLDRVLRREVMIKRRAYVVTLDAEGLRLTLKGHRKGQALRWEDFVSGDAAFANALNASLTQANDAPAPQPRKAPRKKKR
jgi:hypothetical protein